MNGQYCKVVQNTEGLVEFALTVVIAIPEVIDNCTMTILVINYFYSKRGDCIRFRITLITLFGKWNEMIKSEPNSKVRA